jgi:hypothetical protein
MGGLFPTPLALMISLNCVSMLMGNLWAKVLSAGA